MFEGNNAKASFFASRKRNRSVRLAWTVNRRDGQPFTDDVWRTVGSDGGLVSAVGYSSRFEVRWEDRGHNPDMARVTALLEQDVLPLARDLYQNRIHPILGRLDTRDNTFGPDVDRYAMASYLWIEAPLILNELPRREFAEGIDENLIALDAAVANNVYTISIADKRVQHLRVCISSRTVALSRPVTIVVNGRVRFQGLVATDRTRTLAIARGRHDRGVIFDSYVDVAVD